MNAELINIFCLSTRAHMHRMQHQSQYQLYNFCTLSFNCSIRLHHKLLIATRAQSKEIRSGKIVSENYWSTRSADALILLQKPFDWSLYFLKNKPKQRTLEKCGRTSIIMACWCIVTSHVNVETGYCWWLGEAWRMGGMNGRCYFTKIPYSTMQRVI